MENLPPAGPSRRLLVAALAGLSLCLAACKPTSSGPPTPPSRDCNVVLISLDTLRADRLNCYGYERRRTSPNIDALAADGVLFENHIAAAPWTTPAHLSMLTSLNPTAHGVTQSFNELIGALTGGAKFNKLPEARTTLAEVLRGHEYATGAFTAGTTMDPRLGFGQGFDLYDTSMYKLGAANMGAMHNWIGEHARPRFFLFWQNFEIHHPYLRTDFLGEVLTADQAAPVRDQLARLTRKLEGHVPSRQERAVDHNRLTTFFRRQGLYRRDVFEALYVGGVVSADRWVGEFLSELRRQGLYEPALIILTSDHGEEFADHFENSVYAMHGHSLYEEIVRVPLIVKLPGGQHGGTRIEPVVRTIDIMPTILDVLGIEPDNLEMQGTSMRPLWERPDQPSDRIAISESLSNYREKKSVRTDRYKYIFSIDPATVRKYGRAHMPEQAKRAELYDLVADPGEKRDILAGPISAKTADLAATFELRLREAVGARHGEAESVELDRQTIENLKALGYIR